jgi:hypothetical protein
MPTRNQNVEFNRTFAKQGKAAATAMDMGVTRNRRDSRGHGITHFLTTMVNSYRS